LLNSARTGCYIDYGNQRNTILQPALHLARQRGLSKHITPQALRHTMITMLRDGGVAPGVMQLVAGHESYRTTAGYAGSQTPAQRRLILDSVQPVVEAPKPCSTSLQTMATCKACFTSSPTVNCR
jgi:integrase